MGLLITTAPASASAGELRARLIAHASDDEERDELGARWDRYGADLLGALAEIYPETDVTARVVDLIAEGYRRRPERLRQRDRMRVLNQDWFQRGDAIGYAAYVDRFAGTIRGVAARVDYLRQLGVTYLHLMPLLTPRPAPNDGGYAVMDYRTVRPDLGTMADVAALADDLHEAGISLTLDLVLNHVAREHRWATAARAGDQHYADYFWHFPDRTAPDAYEATLPDVFPATAPGNFVWDAEMRAWVWNTFNPWQWDLNWSNPDVFCEFVQIIGHLANHGVDCLRLDAIAFLWKRMGTDCQNQPEVHAITQGLRAAAHVLAPSVVFKAEAIVGPNELVAYLGRGRHAGRVSDMAYHNAFMAQVWSTLATRDARLMVQALSRFAQIPVTTAWVTYLRSHDDLGWAIDDADAESVGWSGPAHRSFLADFYAGFHDASFAEGLVFEENPVNGDRRNSGTAASLLGVSRASDPAALTEAVNRYLCAYAMILGFSGLPVIFAGDELGLVNDEGYADDPEHADDNRWLHRRVMPWDLVDRLDDEPDSASARINRGMRRLIFTRRRLESLHAAVPTTALVLGDTSVLAFVRHHPAGDMIQIYNVTEYPQWVRFAAIAEHVPGASFDEITGRRLQVIDDELELPPYAALWLTTGR